MNSKTLLLFAVAGTSLHGCGAGGATGDLQAPNKPQQSPKQNSGQPSDPAQSKLAPPATGTPPGQSLSAKSPSANPPSAEPPPSVPSPEIALAKESFLKTFAAGEKKWRPKNLVVNYVKTDPLRKKEKEEWSADCTATGNLSVKGNFPNIEFQSSALQCANHRPFEFTELYAVSRAMVFSAYHIPAYPSEPNQFGLKLVSIDDFGILKWKSRSGLNAQTKDRIVFFDLSGELKGNIDWLEDQFVYFDAAIHHEEKSTTDHLKMNFSIHDRSGHDSTDIKVKADLERI